VTQSVLGRLTITHLLVALASVVLVAALSSHLFSVYYVSQRRGELVAAAETLARASEDLLLEADREQLFELTSTGGEMLGGRICVFDAESARLVASSHAGIPGQEQAAAESYLQASLNATEAETTRVECQGLVYSITVPVRHRPSDELLGLVVLRCPIAGIQRIVAAQRFSSVLAAIGAALLAVLLAVMASRAVSRPLRDISQAAQRLAEGDFDVHVEPRGPTEVAMLARATNWSARNLKDTFAQLSAEREKLADVLVSMSDGVLAYDEQGEVMLVNERARELLLLPAGELAGGDIEELLPEPDLRETLGNGTGDEPLALGSRKLHVTTARLSSGGGTVAVIVDVSEAERLERMRRDFVANASHQLRTPLTSIRGYLEALSDGTAASPGQQARCLAIALEQVGLLQGLVDQLLELSRLQARAGPEQRVALSLVEVAERACEHLAPLADRGGVKLVVETDGNPPQIEGDPDRLLQATHNLLDNAIRYTPAGETVHVRVRQRPQGVELAVADRGPGISEGQAEAVWERFQSGDDKTGAAGLGLAITKEIVQAHDGQVSARSNPAGGATFGFILPSRT